MANEVCVAENEQNDMEGILGHQDELIGRINEKIPFLNQNCTSLNV